jgi:NitT/TauT family transport system substrate-binding protein
MYKKIILLALFFILIVTGCAKPPQQSKTLKFAVLPVLDSLPLYVAQANGYFEAEGLAIELIPVGSAPERDQLMQSGQIDGMLNEVVTTLYYNRETANIKIVRFARTATAEYPVFRILAAKNSGITSVADLKGVQIGVSEGTIIEYMADRVLQNAGLTPDEIKKIAVPKIADRTALLESGELKAAVMPDPLASLLMQKGAILIIDDTTLTDVSNSVYSFSNDTLKNYPGEVKAFLRAVEKAVVEINNNKDKYTDLMVEQKLVPESVVGKYPIPDFPTASVPSQAQFTDALSWAMDKGLVTTELKYKDNIDSSFLPK